MFTHLVISRINCNYPVDPHYPPKLYRKIGERQFSRRWLEERLKFLAKYSRPSIMAQTNKNFQWLILLHPDTPEDLILRFMEYRDVGAEVLLTELSPREFVPEYIKDNVKSPWVATTTLDADDAIGNGFVGLIQRNLRETREYLNVTRGFIYSPELGRFYGQRSPTNPFITLVEPTKGAKGVYCVLHGAAIHEAPVRQLDDLSARWVQVFHGDNLLNKAPTGTNKHKGQTYDALRRTITMDL